MSRRLTRRQKVVNLVVGALVVAGISGGILMSRDNAANADVGDCMTEAGPSSVMRVDCADPAASLTVVGRIDGTADGRGPLEACAPYRAQGAERAFVWAATRGRSFVLCLAVRRG